MSSVVLVARCASAGFTESGRSRWRASCPGAQGRGGQLSVGAGTRRPVVRGREDVATSSNGVTERSLPTIDDDDRVREPAPSTSGFGDEKNSEASHDSNGEEDDELRKRAEEFIEKMNGVWRAERKKMLR
ncbi:hypothetical protein B296_00013494 [Ensete ventricosum]|uniref:Uncharacterized protein n=1 Tax=Ensete ventricosum TaxID=4639 RepID=A0A426YG70_ENSVE|nr:hypothetical protein B296_00013494 [Ensete ventricosum]